LRPPQNLRYRVLVYRVPKYFCPAKIIRSRQRKSLGNFSAAMNNRLTAVPRCPNPTAKQRATWTSDSDFRQSFTLVRVSHPFSKNFSRRFVLSDVSSRLPGSEINLANY
jgi:hypothetical protein